MKYEIVKIVDIVRLCPKDSGYFHGYHLGNPKKGNQSSAKNFKLTGWILGKHNFSVISIEIMNKDKLVKKVSLDNPRPDVKDFYQDKDFIQEKIGFATLLDLSEIAQENRSTELSLQACLSQGNKIEFLRLKLSFQTIGNVGPDFIIIGAMKAGTSATYEYLMQHPQIIKRLPKELHFFNLNYEKGLDWYFSQFVCTKENELGQKLLIGEASPSYLPSRRVPARVAEFLPNVKIIVLLRNPTDRAISHYYHQVKRVKDESRPVELAFSHQEIFDITKNQHSKTNLYLTQGQYALYLKRWFEVFPQEQILILNFQELENSPSDYVKKIFTFLNVSDYQIPSLGKIYYNQYPPIPLEVRQRLDQYFEVYNKELEDVFKVKFN